MRQGIQVRHQEVPPGILQPGADPRGDLQPVPVRRLLALEDRHLQRDLRRGGRHRRQDLPAGIVHRGPREDFGVLEGSLRGVRAVGGRYVQRRVRTRQAG